MKTWLTFHPVSFGSLGPEPLSAEFDAFALGLSVGAGNHTSLKVALLDQRVVAGLGNIYASEALHRSRLVTAALRVDHRDAVGAAANDAAERLTTAIKQVLHRRY